MMTKAPKTALMEGMRVLRYLSETKHVGLQFRPCNNYQEVIAYTDANFSAKRSQTGAEVKLGITRGSADVPGAARAPVRCSPLNFPKQSAHL